MSAPQSLIRACRALRAARATAAAAAAAPACVALIPNTTTSTTTRTSTTTSTRPYSSSSRSADAPLPEPQAPGVIEMRRYTLHPAGARDYLRLTQQSAAARTRHLPLLGFFAPELGHDLNTYSHFYAYPGGLDERAERRKAAAEDPEWQAYVSESRPHVAQQRNAALVEWPTLYGAAGGAWGSAAEFAARCSEAADGKPGVFEMRTYRLAATASIRKLVRAFEEGLPAKAEAAAKELGGDQQPQQQQQLALFGSVEVGDVDTVVELWRYPSAEACARARRAARLAPEWKRAVSSVAPGVSQFRCQLLTPVVPLSPMR
jgi:hypothetical protein